MVCPSICWEEKIMKESEKKTTQSKIDELIKYAKTWIGTPYAFSNSRNGIDCTRFVRRCFSHIGVNLPGGYPGPMYRANKKRSLKSFKIVRNLSGVKRLQPGDIIYLVKGDGKHGHAMLYIGDGKIIHSSRSKPNGVKIQGFLLSKGAYKGRGGTLYCCRMFSDVGDVVGSGSARSGVQIYLDEAKKHVGKQGKEWVRKHAPRFDENAWCAETQCALMIVTKFAGKIGPSNEYTAGGFGKAIVTKFDGKYIKGPGYGSGTVIPKPGDIIELHGLECSMIQPWSAGHVGVVEYAKKSQGRYIVHTIEGNSINHEYRRREYDVNSKNILWYARPKWSKVGGDSYLDQDSGDDIDTGTGLLYDNLSTRADATIREVCYADLSGDPSIKKNDLVLSVANYTTVLFWIVYAYGGTGGSSNEDSDSDSNWTFPSGMNANAKYVFNYLYDKGLNKAAICGILGNMRKENTNFVPGLFNGLNHYGICQWSSSRYKETKHSIQAECNLLWDELTHGYKGVLISLKAVKNSESGCKSAAEVFCKKFEVCGNYSYEVPKRQEFALEFYKNIKEDKSDSSNIAGDGKTKGSWIVPVKASYTVNSYGDYGARRSYEIHAGIDMSAPTGTPIYAANGGKVIIAGNYGGYGVCVRIEHSDNLVSTYGHGLSGSLKVKTGQKVSKGDMLMKMDSTGYSTGSHLHFQINKGKGTSHSTSINPRKYCNIHGIGTGK